MNQDDARDPTYVMGRSEDEARRLEERAEFLARPTRLLFEDRASRHPAGGAARGPRRRPEGRQPGKCNSDRRSQTTTRLREVAQRLFRAQTQTRPRSISRSGKSVVRTQAAPSCTATRRYSVPLTSYTSSVRATGSGIQ